MDPTTAGTASNYTITNNAGAPLAVSVATLSPDGRVVTLATAPQTLGTKYTVRLQNVLDIAATPNPIPAGSRAVFFPAGKLMEQNGFIVFEAENYDRNLDGLWVVDATRGTPSGGASVVVPNGAGGNESGTQLEYDVEFAQAATYVVWYRASGNDGNDDSSWLWLNGARPIERAAGNGASMTGFSGQLDFVWRSDSQDGPDPFTVDIPNPGPHVIALARREDGSFHDKFILTTDTSFTPTGLGPPETREGVPAAPTIALTAPTAGQVFAGGSDIVLSADATGGSGLEITSVQFFANGNQVGEATNSPFSFSWQDVPDGIYAITARATDEIGVSTVSSANVVEVGNPPPHALLVVGTVSIPVLNASDAGIKARLESRGWQVSVVQAPASVTADAEGKQLIIVSATINSGDVAAKFRDSAVPAIIWEQAVQDDFLMTLNVDGTDRGTQAGQTNVNVLNTSHPLAAGLTAGITLTTTAAQPYSWGAPNNNAVIIATIADNPARAVIYGYDKGAILADGTTPAPERRTMFFSGDDAFAAFTEDAMKLFDAAIEWTSQVEFQKPTSAKIAWVSFHPASGTPSTTAANAGFSSAPDIGYTDLLEAQGHQVTRIVTSGAPDATLLNAFDLVIISRSVPSGDYQDPPETLAWNGITAPTMILGGYVLRNNRLGLTTGDVMVDITNSIRLTITETNHPVFAGIALDETGTMVDPYVNIAAFTTPTTNLVQRGISVNNSPIVEGGTLLASVATAEDPAFGGLIIAELPAGTATSNPRADVLAGQRLIFLTGSREAANFTGGDAAGIFDLTPTGTQMFLNAVNYLAGTEAAPPRPALSVSRTSTGISITFEGTLESSTSLNGPWAEVQDATSPHAVTPSGPQQFYRAKQ